MSTGLHHEKPAQLISPSQFDISTASDAFELVSNIEINLLAHNTKSTNLDSDNWEDRTAGYLARRVARIPGDLHSHVQRIILHIKLREREENYSALIDLFVAVGSGGKALRMRMLRQSKALLDNKRYKVIMSKMESGINAMTAMPLATNSMLGMGLTGTYCLTEHLLDC